MIETRSVTGIELAEGKLVGYAAVFGKPSHDLGGFVEIIDPNAFARTLKENPDIRALVDHDASKVIGRTTAGTLILTVDSYGLKAEIAPPDTTAGRDILESVRRGDVDGMSFKFSIPKRTGQRTDLSGTPTRTLLDVDLKEISVVTFPAYPDTSVAVRSYDLLALRLQLAEL